jgi:PAS domain S-box-containing protein
MSKPPFEHSFFREIADIAPVMIWIAGLDKLCTYFNRTWLEFSGRDLEDELGNGWADGVHPEDFHNCLEIYERSFDARVPFTMEYRLRRHDGVYRWILDNGKPIYSASDEFLGYAGSCIDISDQKETLLSLERSEERYRIVMDVISEGIWDFNFETNEQYISPSYLSSLGYERGDIEPDVSVKLIEMIHPDDREKTLEAFIAGIESDASFDVEFRQRAKSGEFRWMRSRGRVLFRDANGKPVRVVGTHSDIDARKRAEIALQQNEAQARSAHDELEWIYINAPVGLCIFDREMRYQRINQRLADFVNLSIEEHIGKSIDEIIPDLARIVRNEAQKVLLTGKPSMHHEVTGPLPDAKDQIRTFSFSCYPIFDAQHVVSGYGYVVEDITEQKLLEAQLQNLNAELESKINQRTRELAEVNAALTRLSRTDALTGLHNRLAANERFREENSRLKRTKQPYAVLFSRHRLLQTRQR